MRNLLTCSAPNDDLPRQECIRTESRHEHVRAEEEA